MSARRVLAMVVTLVLVAGASGCGTPSFMEEGPGRIDTAVVDTGRCVEVPGAVIDGITGSFPIGLRVPVSGTDPSPYSVLDSAAVIDPVAVEYGEGGWIAAVVEFDQRVIGEHRYGYGDADFYVDDLGDVGSLRCVGFLGEDDWGHRPGADSCSLISTVDRYREADGDPYLDRDTTATVRACQTVPDDLRPRHGALPPHRPETICRVVPDDLVEVIDDNFRWDSVFWSDSDYSDRPDFSYVPRSISGHIAVRIPGDPVEHVVYAEVTGERVTGTSDPGPTLTLSMLLRVEGPLSPIDPTTIRECPGNSQRWTRFWLGSDPCSSSGTPPRIIGHTIHHLAAECAAVLQDQAES